MPVTERDQLLILVGGDCKNVCCDRETFGDVHGEPGCQIKIA